MADGQAEARGIGQRAEIIRSPFIDLLADAPHRAAAQAAGQVAGVDADRAGGGAQAATGAGIQPLINVVFTEAAGMFAIGGAARQFAPADDALARRQRQPVRRAERFAEAAFDAAVDDVFGGRHGFEVFEVGVRVVVEDDAGVEQVFRVEQLLDVAHQVSGFLAPFHLDKRRHIAASAVFGLQRAIVFLTTRLAMSSMKRA
jgi:hypothetical protein